MTHKLALHSILALMTGTGLLDGLPDAADFGAAALRHLPVVLAAGFMCFLWYRSDSAARGFRGSRWLGLGVAALAPGAIPWYLLRSRPVEERREAVLTFGAYLALAVLAVWVGMAVRISLG